MKVAHSTVGKFHTFDLTCKLHARGTLSGIFTGYPGLKLPNEGLPQVLTYTLPWVARNLPACDLYVGLSGSTLPADNKAMAIYDDKLKP